MSRVACACALGLAILLGAGCQSYHIVQTNVFSDDDGRLVTVEYGQSDRPHTNTFIAPTNGQELEFKSTLMIRAHLPDGDTLKAWQCMNFLPRGTMYKTDDEEWMCLADGFAFSIFHQTQQDKTKYAETFRGVICDVQQSEVKKDERWRTLKKNGEGKWQ